MRHSNHGYNGHSCLQICSVTQALHSGRLEVQAHVNGQFALCGVLRLRQNMDLARRRQKRWKYYAFPPPLEIDKGTANLYLVSRIPVEKMLHRLEIKCSVVKPCNS